jgi:hypothetical protein
MPKDGQIAVEVEPCDNPEEGTVDKGRPTGGEQAAINREDDPPA